jgi:Kef-type K+ transport system membrane component KefB/nucleotide-binding universal stress UspA family protein
MRENVRTAVPGRSPRTDAASVAPSGARRAARQPYPAMRGLSEHTIFVFLLQFAVMLAAARALGALAQKLRQPTVLGELLAGILLGPAVFGHLAPGAQAALFPADATQEHLLEMLSWLGMILLILRTGLELDLRLLRVLGRAAALASFFGILLPYTAGFALGRWMPEGLLAHGGNRTVFALFLATAMSISAVKVIAKTLLDLKLTRRDIGAVILAASMADDTIGWVLLSIVSSIAVSGVVSAPTVLRPIAATVLVIAAAALVGRPLLRRLIGWIERGRALEHGTISAILVLTFALAALTERLGIHAVFGAFIAGLLVTASPRVRQATLEGLDSVILGVFAPIFFVYTGLKVTTLEVPPLQITAAILGVAIVAKVVGAGLGARLGGMGVVPALAVGIGMSSRGSMELVVARIGMDLGVLTPSLYAAIVLIPIVTSVSTPMLLRAVVGAAKPEAEEATRLVDEQEQQQAMIKREGAKILVALSGGPRSYQAMRLAAPLARLPGATMVAISVVADESGGRLTRQRRPVLTAQQTRATLARFAEEESVRDFHPRIVTAPSPAAAIEDELLRGYDLVFVGAGRRRMVSNRIVTAAVQGGAGAVIVSGDSFPGAFKRILVPTDGGYAARAAAELALLYASAATGEVTALTVQTNASSFLDDEPRRISARVLQEIVQLGARHGVAIDGQVRVSQSVARTTVEAARELSADLIVLGGVPQTLGRQTFLGNTVEYVLRYAPCPVAVFLPPSPRGAAKAA